MGKGLRNLSQSSSGILEWIMVRFVKSHLFVGVSGFSYPSWKGKFYPKDLKSEAFLEFYSQKLNSVEINSSFYAPPSSTMVSSWQNKSGEGFRFSFKAPRQITHISKLGEGSVEATIRLGKTLNLLGAKLGPVLFQLPPFSKQDLKVLETFLQETSTVKNRVFEFRHESWLNETTYQLLEKYGAGFCIAETEDMNPVLRVTGGTPYFRLRKDSYDKKTISDWAGKIDDTIKGSKEAYVYLRHDETGENTSLALHLTEKISP